MKLDWSTQIAQIEPMIDQIKQASIAASLGFNSVQLPKKEVEEAIQICLDLLKEQNGTEIQGILYSIHHSAVVQNIANLVVNLPNLLSSNGASPYSDNFISPLWSAYASLKAIQSDNAQPKKNLLENFDKYLTNNPVQKAKLDKLVEYDKALQTAQSATEKTRKKLDVITEKAGSLLKSMEQHNLEITNFKNLADSNAIQTTTTKDQLETLLNNIKEKGLNADTLLESLNDIKSDAERTLGLTSQVALASSFKDRKNALEINQIFWRRQFIVGLAILFGFTAASISASEFLHFPTLIVDGHIDIWGAIVRLLLSGPIIWLTWFSVKQFNNNVALIEDYAFKEASALAFVGYKKDMQSDDEMVKLLSESAIKNFSYAPSRLISSNDPASPMHDLFESALKDKGLFDRLVELLKVLKPTKD